MGQMQGAFGRSWMRQPQGQAMPTQQQSPFASMFSQYMQRPMFQAATQQRQSPFSYLPLLLARGMFNAPQAGSATPTTPATPGTAPALPAVPPISNVPSIASQAPPQLYQATPPIQQAQQAAPPPAAAPAQVFGRDPTGQPTINGQPLTYEQIPAYNDQIAKDAMAFRWGG